MKKIGELHRRWSKNADYKNAYDALGEEFDIVLTRRSAHYRRRGRFDSCLRSPQ